MSGVSDEFATPEVRINGVLYVPVNEASPHASAIEDAVVGQWAGEEWRDRHPDAPTYLRVVVGDTFDPDEGQSVEEFVAAVLARLSGRLGLPT